MADRNSARIFGAMFIMLAEDLSEGHMKLARRLYQMTHEYDFCDEQMGCEKALKLLKVGEYAAQRSQEPQTD